MKSLKSDKPFLAVAQRLKQIYPDVFFDVYEDSSALRGFYIAVLSMGPDYAPDIQSELPAGWVFRGWRNPDQRNNMGMILWDY